MTTFCDVLCSGVGDRTLLSGVIQVTFLPWGWSQQIPPKRVYQTTRRDISEFRKLVTCCVLWKLVLRCRGLYKRRGHICCLRLQGGKLRQRLLHVCFSFCQTVCSHISSHLREKLMTFFGIPACALGTARPPHLLWTMAGPQVVCGQ